MLVEENCRSESQLCREGKNKQVADEVALKRRYNEEGKVGMKKDS